MKALIRELEEKFQTYFKTKPRIFRSPGRINVIGEHTDYNDGFVLPAAIDKASFVAVDRSQTNETSIVALDLNAKIVFDIETELQPLKEGGWQNYALGVVNELKKKGLPLKNFNLIFASNVPIGAGMSSSAAVECSIAFALNSLFSLGLERKEIAKIGQSSEHNFVGISCGIMDQFASCMGKENHVFKLDCRSLEHTYVPLDLGAYCLVLFDTNVKHSLADSQYNLRRQQCELGAAAIRAIQPGVKALRDATLEDLEAVKDRIDDTVYNRCKYVIEENTRVALACEALEKKDLETLGKLMFETHKGLSKLYEVSCEELDILVRMAKHEYPVFGARMMGGGFGGCTINLVETSSLEYVVEKFQREYYEITNSNFTVHQVKISNGAEELVRV